MKQSTFSSNSMEYNVENRMFISARFLTGIIIAKQRGTDWQLKVEHLHYGTSSYA